MKLHTIGRRMLLAVALLLLLGVAWLALSGAVSQIPRSETIGQKAESAVQVVCGILSVLTAAAAFYRNRRYDRIRKAWAVSLATTAGMSSLVWGPPMIGVALAFAAGSILLALGIFWMIRVGRG